MNEKIKQLAGQLDFPIGLTDPQWAYEERLYKFAELIVQECVGVVDGMADPEDSERYFWAIQNASKKIKQHFGVEE